MATGDIDADGYDEIITGFRFRYGSLADAYGLRFAALRYFNAAGASPAGDIGEDHHRLGAGLVLAGGEAAAELEAAGGGEGEHGAREVGAQLLDPLPLGCGPGLELLDLRLTFLNRRHRSFGVHEPDLARNHGLGGEQQQGSACQEEGAGKVDGRRLRGPALRRCLGG